MGAIQQSFLCPRWIHPSVKVGALFSGGKDSTYALYTAQQMGWEVSSLLTLVPRNPASHMYHVPNIHLVPILSDCLGIPLVQREADSGETNELEALKSLLKIVEIDGVVTGAIESEYQKARIDRVCHELGLRTFSPLWRRRQADLLDDYLTAGFRVLIVGVAAEGLDSTWLGRELDHQAKEQLLALHKKHGLSPCGEGGEYESLVLDGPNFHRRLQVIESRTEWNGTSGQLNITKAEAVEKDSWNGAARI